MKQDFTIPVPQPPGRRRLFRPWPRFTSAALLIALGSGLGVFAYQCKTHWTPLQRAYFPAYVRAAHAASAQSGLDPQAHLFSLLVITYPHDTRIALDSNVVIIPADAAAPHSVAFSLSPMALKDGARRLEWRSWRLEDAKLHAWLAHWVYNDRGPWQLFRDAWYAILLCLVLTLPLAVPKDFADRRTWHLRRALTRAGLVSRSQFHRCARDHRGVGWLTTDPASLWERIFVDASERRRVRIPAQHETEHILIVGDAGTGKSSLLHQLLVQVQDRNETAIIYDPAMEYVPQFFNAERGDVILNPLDERMPYWDLAYELEDRDKAEAIARSLIPDRETQDRFLVEAPRLILAHLLRFYP